jgi:predicted ABC-type ATPase
MTPDEHASHSRYAEEAIARALDAGKATTVTHTYDGHGQVWNPERAAMHKDMVDEMLERAERVPSGRRMTLLGGLQGSAKKSVAGQAAPDREHLHVSVPGIKHMFAERGMIPAVSGLSPMEASPLVHGEAEHVADMTVRAAMRRGKNVAVHTAMADPETVRKHVQRAHEAGYTVHGVFVHTPAGKAAAAVVAAHRSGHEKYRQEQSPGSRYLSPALVRSAETGPGQSVNSEGFEKSKPVLGSWEHWDASDGLKKTASSGIPGGSTIPSPEEVAGVG